MLAMHLAWMKIWTTTEGEKFSRTTQYLGPKAEIKTERFTYTWRQVVVPCPSLSRHAPEYVTAMQGVTLVTAKRDSTASKVTPVTDFKSKLWHTRIIAVGQLKAWTGRIDRHRRGAGWRKTGVKSGITRRPWTHTNIESPVFKEKPFCEQAPYFHLSNLKRGIDLWALRISFQLSTD